MKSILTLCALISFLPFHINAAPKAILGIAGGTHMLNDDFDFALSLPGGWDSVASPPSRDASPEPADVWRLTNARVAGTKDASHMKIEFYSSLAIKDLAALRVYVEANYPDHKWSDYVDQTLVGLKSTEIPDPTDSQAKLGHLFYFMDRNMIVAVHWRRHPSNGGDRGISELILSMDRKTAPPVVRSLSYSKPGPVKPGEDLCLYIKVDDLKSSFNAASMSHLELEGFASAYIWQNVAWNESAGRFDVCFQLPTSVGSSNDLKISYLTLTNERSNSLHCSIRPPSVELTCGDFASSSYPVKIALPTIDNSNPDRSPPELDSVDIDQSTGRAIAKIRAHDASGFSGGWMQLQQIPGGLEKIFIAPWQIESGQIEIDLTPYSTSGTRRIAQIALADKNSIGVSYVDCIFVKDPAVMCKFGTYARCIDTKCNATEIPVVEYFSKRKPQN